MYDHLRTTKPAGLTAEIDGGKIRSAGVHSRVKEEFSRDDRFVFKAVFIFFEYYSPEYA